MVWWVLQWLLALRFKTHPHDLENGGIRGDIHSKGTCEISCLLQIHNLVDVTFT